jgi:hypothetical protein
MLARDPMTGYLHGIPDYPLGHWPDAQNRAHYGLSGVTYDRLGNPVGLFPAIAAALPAIAAALPAVSGLVKRFIRPPTPPPVASPPPPALVPPSAVVQPMPVTAPVPGIAPPPVALFQGRVRRRRYRRQRFPPAATQSRGMPLTEGGGSMFSQNRLAGALYEAPDAQLYEAPPWPYPGPSPSPWAIAQQARQMMLQRPPFYRRPWPPGWVSPSQPYTGLQPRRLYLRCSVWPFRPGLVPAFAAQVPGTPGMPGMPGAPGMPVPMTPQQAAAAAAMGFGRRRRRRRR